MSYYFEANNQQSTILEGYLELPLDVNWYGEIEIEAGVIPPEGTVCKITVLDQQWICRAGPGGNWHNRARLRVAGGCGQQQSPVGGDITKRLKPKDYQQIPVRIPIQDILRDCNMKLANQPDVLNKRLTTWVRMAGPASTALILLLKQYNHYFRVLEDGSVGIYDAAQTYAKATYVKDIDYQEMDFDPIKRKYVIAVNTKLITHSDSFVAQDADLITHLIDSSKLRTLVYLKP